MKEKSKKEKEDKEEIILEEKPIVEKKGNGGVIFLVIACIVMLFVSMASVALLIFSNRNNNNTNKDGSLKQENVELTYTEPVTSNTTGIYITDVSEVVDKVMPSIVAITSKTIINSGNFGPYYYRGGNTNYTAVGAGSGVIISEDENKIYILTNNHVVEDSDELSVKFIDDKSYDAKIVGVSENNDIAIVSVSKKDVDSDTLSKIKIATLGSSDELKVGNGIIAIGNALGYGQSVTTGVVSALNRDVQGDDSEQVMIQIDAAINGGNSGGALLNSKGEVVGINTAKYSLSAYATSSSSIEGMGFAIPISDVKSVIDKIMNGETVDEDDDLTIGIEGYMISSNNGAYGLPSGFYISKITSGGNAEKSELEIGNIVVEIDGNKVTSMDVFKSVLSKKSKGDKVTLKVKYASKNEYKEKTVEVTLN